MSALASWPESDRPPSSRFSFCRESIATSSTQPLHQTTTTRVDGRSVAQDRSLYGGRGTNGVVLSLTNRPCAFPLARQLPRNWVEFLIQGTSFPIRSDATCSGRATLAPSISGVLRFKLPPEGSLIANHVVCGNATLSETAPFLYNNIEVSLEFKFRDELWCNFSFLNTGVWPSRSSVLTVHSVSSLHEDGLLLITIPELELTYCSTWQVEVPMCSSSLRGDRLVGWTDTQTSMIGDSMRTTFTPGDIDRLLPYSLEAL
ncbi:hypothetical protein GE21DRAFT_1320402 [Neurospora crassa]|nr:hypothetical protein GE21DRAFT_1320402 [Neurospora crassa]